MTPKETVLLARYVKACCPQQKFDEYTADAWFDVLGELPLSDCKAAVTALAREQPFIGPSEIWGEVRRIRRERIKDAGGVPAPPPDLLDDPQAYGRALQAAATAIADGRDPQAAMAAITRQRPRELEA